MLGVLVDVTRCTGCEKCVVACTKRNGGDLWQAERDAAVTPDGLSSRRLSSIVKAAEGRYAKKSCVHCLDPACASACLVGALAKTAGGPVLYDRDKCIGCRYCMLACPFHVPRYEWDKTFPYVVKCDLCTDRVAAGKQPACVQACPEGALKFGDRERLLGQAHETISSEPGRYLDHVWGEKEFGGSAVMYIADVDLAALGWPPGGAVSIPALTEPLVHATPFIGLGVASALLGLNWIVERRNRLGGRHE